MKVLLQDFKVAIRTMGKSAWNATKTGLIIGAGVAAALSTFVLFIAALRFYPGQSIIVMLMTALTIWFLIELETARFARQKEEEDRQWREAKNQPAHGSKK